MNTLTSDNCVMYAMKHYSTPSFSGMQDFYNDMRRFAMLNTSFQKWKSTNGEKVHNIVSHIIIICNTFGKAAIPLLFFKVKEEFHSLLKTVLIFINRIVGNEQMPILCDFNLTPIPVNQKLMNSLMETAK